MSVKNRGRTHQARPRPIQRDIYTSPIGVMLNGRTHNKAGDAAVTENWIDYDRLNVPKIIGSRVTAITKAREVIKSCYWLSQYFKKKRQIYNFGLEIAPSPIGKKGSSKSVEADEEKLRLWMGEDVGKLTVVGDVDDTQVGAPGTAFKTNGERIRKFIRECWDEFNLLQCCIAYWTESFKYAVTLPPEKCRYKDVLGVETLFYTHGLGEQEKKLMLPEDAARFEKPEILITDANGDFFKVAKTERTGFGLDLPDVQAIFRVAAQLQDMELSEHTYSYAGKMKFRHHKLGHEIKQGPMAGKATHFWNKKWGDGARRVFENKTGFLGDYFGRHDHVVELWYEDIEYYDKKKWDSPEHRLIQWGGPIAAMLVATGVTPFLGQLLRAEASEAREIMKDFLELVINDAFDVPIPIQLSWSNTIFFETQILTDTLKTGLSSGAISQETWREQSGFNNAKEYARKIREAKDKKTNPEAYKPAFDQSHGDQDDGGEGKPPGRKDSDSAQK